MLNFYVLNTQGFFSYIRLALEKIKSDVYTDYQTKSLELEYNSLINRHEGLILSICYEYSSTKEDLEDLIQNVRINIWRGLKNFKKESRVETWIYRVALNTCISSIRRRKTPINNFDFYECESMEKENQRFENVEYIHRLLQTLNFEERAIIILWLEERTYEEISEIIGIGRNTIASRIKRIKEKLIRNSKKL